MDIRPLFCLALTISGGLGFCPSKNGSATDWWIIYQQRSMPFFHYYVDSTSNSEVSVRGLWLFTPLLINMSNCKFSIYCVGQGVNTKFTIWQHPPGLFMIHISIILTSFYGKLPVLIFINQFSSDVCSVLGVFIFILLLQYHQPEASDSALSRAVELILDGSLPQYFLYSYDLINIMRVSESLPRPTHSKWMQVMAPAGFRRCMRVWLKKLHSTNISLCFRARWWENFLFRSVCVILIIAFWTTDFIESVIDSLTSEAN